VRRFESCRGRLPNHAETSLSGGFGLSRSPEYSRNGSRAVPLRGAAGPALAGAWPSRRRAPRAGPHTTTSTSDSDGRSSRKLVLRSAVFLGSHCGHAGGRRAALGFMHGSSARWLALPGHGGQAAQLPVHCALAYTTTGKRRLLAASLVASCTPALRGSAEGSITMTVLFPDGRGAGGPALTMCAGPGPAGAPSCW
jgi:hypothetical protein